MKPIADSWNGLRRPVEAILVIYIAYFRLAKPVPAVYNAYFRSANPVLAVCNGNFCATKLVILPKFSVGRWKGSV